MIAACASIPVPPPPNSSNTLVNGGSFPNPNLPPFDRRDFDICASALRNMQPRWRGVSWLVSTVNSRASYETDVDLSTSGGAEVTTCDSSLMNKLIERSNEVLNLSNQVPRPHCKCLAHPDIWRPLPRRLIIHPYFFGTPVVGLTASGTFHEPASGRLSLLHQAGTQTSSATDLATKAPIPSPLNLGWSNTPHTATDYSKSHLTTPLPNPLEDSITAEPQQTLTSNGGTGAALMEAQLSQSTFPCTSISATDPSEQIQSLLDSSSWVAQSIPQIFWPNPLESNVPNIGLDCAKAPEPVKPFNTSTATLALSSTPNPIPASNDEMMGQAPTPVLPKGVLEALFRGEVGVWSSFRNV